MYSKKRIFIGLLLIIPMMSFSIKEKIIVYTIGDSTMANKDTFGNPERGWAMALPLFSIRRKSLSKMSYLKQW
jgi:hypothetical protein